MLFEMLKLREPDQVKEF